MKKEKVMKKEQIKLGAGDNKVVIEASQMKSLIMWNI